jgi:hypothetical protein
VKRAIVLVMLAAGCGEVRVEALTVPPPGKTAQLDAENQTLHLSRGVAFAFECTEWNGDGYSGPCRGGTATGTNPEVATVFKSYLDTLAPAYDGGDLGPRSRAAYVVVGLAVGEAKVRVDTPDDHITIDVTVIP